MKRGEIWLINLDPTSGAEIKKQDLLLLLMMMIWDYYRLELLYLLQIGKTGMQ